MTDEVIELGAILYPGFEMLDLFGPLEMFSLLGPERVNINMVAQNKGPVTAAMGTDIEHGPKSLADFMQSRTRPR